MEYNIRSNDDSINEVILSELKNLDDTFFANYSDSEGEESNSVLDDESISDDDFPDIPLNKLNEFNFVDVPDNYIEDKIYDDLKLKIKKFFDKGQCSCRSKQSCFEKIGYKKFLARRAEFESLEKNMRDMVIKGQLLAFQRNENMDKVTNDDRKNLRFSYCYNHDVPHLQEHGLEERIHGNTSRAPKNMNHIEVNYDLACKDKYGKDARILAESTFTNIWKSLMPSLQFMSSKTDLCETCEIMKMDIRYTIQYEKKLELTNSYLAHLNRAQKEHDYYNINIINAVEDGKHNPNVVGSQILFKSFSAFKNLPHIQKYHHFYFTSQHPGIVFFKDDLQDSYESFTIRPFSFNADTLLPTIDVKPLSQKRQEELYKEIAPYIDLPFRNITCPEPKIQDK
ncbi:9232_t:CDS:2, partial [Scutellospora calospora]